MQCTTASCDADSFVRYGWISCANRIELLHARFRQHRFAPHAHDSWSIGAVVAGVKDIATPSQSNNLVRRGDVYVIPPEQAHAGCSADEQPCEYVMLYVPDNEWRAQCARRGFVPENCSSTPIASPQLSQHIAAFVQQVLQDPSPQHDWESAWSGLCDEFVRLYRPATRLALSSSVPDRRVSLVRDYLRTYWDCPVTLDQLARLASLSSFELSRRFAAAYGLPPHRYQLVLRIIEAKARLLDGARIADVATATGFADQSHLGRLFKAVLGITPGTLSRQADRASCALPLAPPVFPPSAARH